MPEAQPVSTPTHDYQQHQTSISARLETVLKTSALGTVIAFKDIVDVPWDRMCVYYEGATGAAINADVGSTWSDPTVRIYNQQYVLFVHGTHVTMDFPLTAPILAIDTEDAVHCISQEQAVFRVAGIDGAAIGGMTRFYARVK